MNNLQFYMLQLKIQDTMATLSELQGQHRKITGVQFIYGQMIDEPGLCETCRHLKNVGSLETCTCKESEFFEKDNPVWGCSEHDTE